MKYGLVYVVFMDANVIAVVHDLISHIPLVISSRSADISTAALSTFAQFSFHSE